MKSQSRTKRATKIKRKDEGVPEKVPESVNSVDSLGEKNVTKRKICIANHLMMSV